MSEARPSPEDGIDAACDRFVSAWKAGRGPWIEETLPEVAGPDRPALLRRLLALEVELRRGRGERPDPREYHARFPGDADAIDAAFGESATAGPTTHAEAPGTLTQPAEADGNRPSRDQGGTPPEDVPPTEVYAGRLIQEEMTVAGSYSLPPAPAGFVPPPRFKPGQIVSARYQIVALLGRGGMGEVYRADDLTLGQSVALKFLTAAQAGDAKRLASLRGEVRIARQVSHPHVCRVYDIGEEDGHPFLTMEYIDGEDLSALLRRIGRLPEDKALELARQICAGLEAAHHKGVLHRDLKPQNVMIDGRGQAHITDFGLAGFAGQFRPDELFQGTPAYMAPEQRAEREVTVRSDVYALGLVLYEMFTGRRAFPDARWGEDWTPSSPSSLVRDLDPAVERIILRCLEEDPQRRPTSALAVAAALPGGDPLMAALAAGETPSPAMVTNAATEAGLSVRVGAILLAGIIVGLVLVAVLNDRVKLFRQVPLSTSPYILAHQARHIIEVLRQDPRPPVDRAYGFSDDWDAVRHLAVRDHSPSRWAGLATGQPAAMYFWYRQGPRHFDPKDQPVFSVPGMVTPYDPTPLIPGSASVFLDPKGRLIGFLDVPRHDTPSVAPAPRPAWKPLFDEAGLDLAHFRKTDPDWSPPVQWDERAAWEGTFPERPEIRIRVEAAAYRGQPVYFQVRGPWHRPEHIYLSTSVDRPTYYADYASLLLTVLVVAVSALLARRNVQKGRADLGSTYRLGLYLFWVNLLCWVFAADHCPSFDIEIGMFLNFLGYAVSCTGVTCVCYLALEPYIRRRWPWRIISWNRLLAGRVLDPLVGRDVLIGGLLGVSWTFLEQLIHLSPGWVGRAPSIPFPLGANVTFLSSAVLPLLACQVSAVQTGLTNFTIFFLLAFLSRRETLAFAIVLLIVLAQMWMMDPEMTAIKASLAALNIALVFAVALRFGLLAVTVGLYYYHVSLYSPLTYDLSSWYARNGLVAAAVLAGLAVLGFVTSKANRPLIDESFFPEEWA